MEKSVVAIYSDYVSCSASTHLDSSFDPSVYDLEVVIKVKDRDHEISVMRFSNFYVLEEDVVDIGMGVDGARGTLGGGDGSMDQLP